MRDSGGRGLMRAVPNHAPWANLFVTPLTADTAQKTLANDWYFAGRGPAPVTEISWRWLSHPLRFRPDPPLNTAQVSQFAGGRGYALDRASVRERGQSAFTHTTYAASAVDAANLATWIVTYYRNPRVRLSPVLMLNGRTPSEIRLILRQQIGDRIRITDTPVGWPEGGIELVIEGYEHRAAKDVRTVRWSLAPVIGAEPDRAGPWFRTGVSQLGGIDALPF